MGGALEQSSNFEYVAPDRYHSTRDSVTGLQTNGETIVIGKDTWVKRNDQWKKSPVDMSNAFASIQSALNGDTMKGVDVRLLGPDTVDGTPTLVYAYTRYCQVNWRRCDQATNAAYCTDAHLRLCLPSSSLPCRNHQSLRLVILSLCPELSRHRGNVSDARRLPDL
jgi:hypothetical protein